MGKCSPNVKSRPYCTDNSDTRGLQWLRIAFRVTVSTKIPGQAIVHLNGKDIYLGEHGTPASREKYNRVIGEWLAAGRMAPQATNAAGGLTVGALALAYWNHAEGYYKDAATGQPTGELWPLKAALRVLRLLYSDTPAATFGPLALTAVRALWMLGGWSVYAQDPKPKAKPWSRGVINHQCKRIKRAFRWAVENEMIPASVAHGLSAVAPLMPGRSEAHECARVMPAADADIEAAKQHMGPTVKAMVDVQLLAGMRPAEVCRMRAADICMDADVWKYTPEKHKLSYRGTSREIFLGPKAIATLRPFLTTTGYIFSPQRAEVERNAQRREDRKSPMTPSQLARKPKKHPKRTPQDQYTPNSYRRAVQRACVAAGVPSWHPNQLRHSCATRLRKVAGIDAARGVLGHTSTEMTEVYAERDQKQSQEIMKLVG